MKRNEKSVLQKRAWIIVLAAFVAVAATVIICVSLPGEGNDARDKESYEMIQSKYMNWAIPSECMPFLKYEKEETQNTVADMFYMLVGTAEVPVFRFDFGDKDAGDWLGVLTIGEEEIPVVYTVFMVSDEELAALGEGADETYYMLMDVFNEMVQDLSASDNFSADKPIRISGNKQEAVLTYWTVELPTEMTWRESNENGAYQAVFYGDIQGEMVALYQVSIGEATAEGQLGLYRIDGEDKIISVYCYDVLDRADITEEDNAMLYLLMDTVNDVIEQITSSKNYCEFSEE